MKIAENGVWKAYFKSKSIVEQELKITAALAAGADVDEKGHIMTVPADLRVTMLELIAVLYDSELMDEKRANLIITLLAWKADPSIVHKKTFDSDIINFPYSPIAYPDQQQVLVILRNVATAQEDLQNILAGAMALLRTHPVLVKDIRKTLSSYFINNVVNEKLNTIRKAVPADDWTTYDKNQLRHAIEFNIRKNLKQKNMP